MWIQQIVHDVITQTPSFSHLYKMIKKITPFQYQENNKKYEGWNFNNGSYLFTTDTK